MSTIVRVVRRTFKQHPLIANLVLYGTMGVGAETSQQILIKRILNETEPPEPIDKAAVGRQAILNTLIVPNILFFWYKWLDKKFVGTAPKLIVKKVLIDQFVMTPPLFVIVFVVLSVLEGKQKLFEECRQKFFLTFKTSCAFWLPAQAINFILVPPNARVTMVGCCTFLWINIFCWIRRNDYKKIQQ